eukprot:scaffold270086_cov15-Tisochrysis_lutea.AAC.1
MRVHPPETHAGTHTYTHKPTRTRTRAGSFTSAGGQHSPAAPTAGLRGAWLRHAHGRRRAAAAPLASPAAQSAAGIHFLAANPAQPAAVAAAGTHPAAAAVPAVPAPPC